MPLKTIMDKVIKFCKIWHLKLENGLQVELYQKQLLAAQKSTTLCSASIDKAIKQQNTENSIFLMLTYPGQLSSKKANTLNQVNPNFLSWKQNTATSVLEFAETLGFQNMLCCQLMKKIASLSCIQVIGQCQQEKCIGKSFSNYVHMTADHSSLDACQPETLMNPLNQSCSKAGVNQRY